MHNFDNHFDSLPSPARAITGKSALITETKSLCNLNSVSAVFLTWFYTCHQHYCTIDGMQVLLKWGSNPNLSFSPCLFYISSSIISHSSANILPFQSLSSIRPAALPIYFSVSVVRSHYQLPSPLLRLSITSIHPFFPSVIFFVPCILPYLFYCSDQS